jgi:hypothetical protein
MPTVKIAPHKPRRVLWVELQAHDATRQVNHSVRLVFLHCPSVQVPRAHGRSVRAPVLVVMATKTYSYRAACRIPGQTSHLQLLTW